MKIICAKKAIANIINSCGVAAGISFVVETEFRRTTMLKSYSSNKRMLALLSRTERAALAGVQPMHMFVFDEFFDTFAQLDSQQCAFC